MENQRVRPIYLFLLVATMILLGFHFWSLYKKPKIVTPPVQNMVPENTPIPGMVNPLYVYTKKITESNQYTTIGIEYPELKNIDVKENRKISEFYTKFITEHNKISKENLKARFETDEANAGKSFSALMLSEDDKFPAYGKYTPFQVNDDYVSVLFLYGAFQGGAHGFENYFSLNYDVKNKKTLTLTDILKDKKIEQASILDFLSEESRKQLLIRFAPEVEYKKSIDDLVYDHDQYEFIIDSIYSGTEPDSKNFSIYTFTPDELTIYFGQYQVASYVEGMQEVKIPLK